MELENGYVRLDPPPREIVHVWMARLDADVAESFAGVLSQAERARAERFVRAGDRLRSTMARVVLRTTLGSYLGIDPACIQISEDGRGKPFLVRASGGPPLCFNLAHSGDGVLLAVTNDQPVGVDLEQVSSELDFMELAVSQFSAEEVRRLKEQPATEQREAFFRCWTRKEAYLKARGVGLGLALDKFSVTLARGEGARLSWVEDDPEAASRWTMFDLDLSSGFAGAVVVEGPAREMIFRPWRSFLSADGPDGESAK